MELFAPYTEINTYVCERFHQPITISFVSEKEVKVKYTRRVFIKDLSVNVNLRVIEVTQDSVTVTYGGMLGIDKIIRGALGFLNLTGIYLEDDHTIRINLPDIEKARAVVENISLRDITANEKGLRIDFGLKVPPAPASVSSDEK